MAINQAYSFLFFSINGVIIGLIFDFFRILRKAFKTNNLITYIEDILFWILTGISIIIFMCNFSDGNLRLYMLIGLILGFLIYIFTISKYIIKFFVYIINILKKVMNYILKIINIPINFLNNLLKSVYIFIYKKTKVNLSKMSHFFKKKTNKFRQKLLNKS